MSHTTTLRKATGTTVRPVDLLDEAALESLLTLE